jgi:hypothetical protein
MRTQKALSRIGFASLVFSLLSSPSQAFEIQRIKRVKQESAERPIVASRSVADFGSASSRIGFGFATSQNVTGTDTALTLWFGLSGANAIQAYFVIPSTNPFQVMVAGIIKHSVAEAGPAGFHIGGGFGIGGLERSVRAAGNGVVLTVNGVAGFRFPVPGASNILVNLDGGPSFQLFDSDANFEINALSPGLGASVVYLF